MTGMKEPECFVSVATFYFVTEIMKVKVTVLLFKYT